MKIILAGLLGGIIIFCWSFVAHMMTPLGKMGISVLPAQQEQAVLTAIRQNINEPGMFFIPGMDLNDSSEAAMAAFAEKYKAGASGFFVTPTVGEEPISLNKLMRELGTDIAAALLGAFVIFFGAGRSGFGRTVFLATLLGLMSWFLISTSYNIWYRFPRDFIIAEGITEVVGFLLAGIGFAVVGMFFKEKH
jgi:hypothetical protein